MLIYYITTKSTEHYKNIKIILQVEKCVNKQFLKDNYNNFNKC